MIGVRIYICSSMMSLDYRSSMQVSHNKRLQLSHVVEVPGYENFRRIIGVSLIPCFFASPLSCECPWRCPWWIAYSASNQRTRPLFDEAWTVVWRRNQFLTHLDRGYSLSPPELRSLCRVVPCSHNWFHGRIYSFGSAHENAQRRNRQLRHGITHKTPNLNEA
jgi:hypothetical protein